MTTDSRNPGPAALPFGSWSLATIASRAQLGPTRRAFASWLDAMGRRESSTDWELVLAELLANAVEASPGEPFEVWALALGTYVSVDVLNPLPVGLPIPVRVAPAPSAPPPDVGPAPAAPLAPHGRGLQIVRSLVDGVTLQIDQRDPDRDRLRIHCWRDRHPE